MGTTLVDVIRRKKDAITEGQTAIDKSEFAAKIVMNQVKFSSLYHPW